jgi:CheY-like chemotaxis protein/prolyl-tRNA editing enzyme YbaK/EbsC (Cys-tRNA(Pro) deacylase)
MMSLPRWLERLFSYYRVPYEVHQHLPVHSANQLAHAEHVSGHRVAKPVFLALGTRPLMVVVPASARLDVGRVQEVLGRKDIRLAGEEEIAGWFKGCPAGAIPPVRLRSDLMILMDRSLAHLGTMLFAAGSSEEAVSMPFRAWYRMVRPGVGRFTQVNGQQARPRPLVLVVEDESDTNHLLCQLLERKGFASRGAVDGQAALALAAELRPSAILLDLMLPDMNGFDMYERMRSLGPIKLPPAVVVTALEDDAMRRRGQDLGADAYLTKPFFPDSLMRELDNVLADARA